MTTTKVTDAATALYTVLKTALTTVEVLDGPWQTESSVPVYVVVGHDDDPDSNEAVFSEQIPSDLSRNVRQEAGAVNCVIVATSGGTDMAALRASAKATFTDVGTTLATDPTLGGVVQRAEYGTQFLLKQIADDQGISARLLFSIGYTASV